MSELTVLTEQQTRKHLLKLRKYYCNVPNNLESHIIILKLVLWYSSAGMYTDIHGVLYEIVLYDHISFLFI